MLQDLREHSHKIFPVWIFFHGTILATFIFCFFSTLRLNLGPQANYANTWCWAISPGFILFQTLFWGRDVHRFFTGWSWTHSVAQAVKMYYPPASATLTLGITDVYHQAWLPSCFPKGVLLTILYFSIDHVCHHRHLWPQWMVLSRIEGAVYILGPFDLERERKPCQLFSMTGDITIWVKVPMWYLISYVKLLSVHPRKTENHWTHPVPLFLVTSEFPSTNSQDTHISTC